MGICSFNTRRDLLFALALLSFIFLLYYFRAEEQIANLKKANYHALDHVPDDQVLIFNRIPKTASTTFMHLPYELCTSNGFNVILVEVNRPQHYLTLADRLDFVRNISSWQERLPALYHGHFAYVDFEAVGSRTRPLYINLVREPVERLVSYYYFLRYGDDYRVNKIRSRMGDKTTFDECVKAKKPDCDPKKLWLQIPWFCGSHKKCWEPGNRWALEQAKHNLVHKYFLVGLTEDLESFISILESTLPRFFNGATDLFRSANELKHIRRTKHKDVPSAEAIAALQQTRVWKMEHEFYEFAKAQFDAVKSEVLEAEDVESGKRKNLFRYEKLRPRP